MRPIPFNLPFIVGKELSYISQVIEEGNLDSDGRFTQMCTQWMEESFSAKKVVLTHSCTAALEISAILSNVEPGDEVIMPSFTFVSTANAFKLRGAQIRFVDIREDTLNIDEARIEEAITPRTRVIVPVHYAGIGAEMDVIMEIANRHDLLVVEDAAQGVNATHKGRYLGTIGQLGTYSFHSTKNLTCGEGGALLVNDDHLVERAEIIRDKGTNRAKFFRGEVDKYSWVDLGSSYLASELVAAFLYAQLEQTKRITAQRQLIVDRYERAFEPLEQRGLVRLPARPPECQHNAHMFYLVLPTEEQRDALLAHPRAHAIHAVFHYIPLHSSPMGLEMGYEKSDLPITEELSSRILRLPCYFQLGPEDQDRVIDTTTSFLTNTG